MSKQFTILFLLFLLSLSVAARSWKPGPCRDEIDRLIKTMPFLKDSGRVDCLNKLSELYHWFTSPTPHLSMIDTAKNYANQALQEAEKINYIHGKGMAYQNLGCIEWMTGTDLPLMEKYFTASLSLLLKTTDYKQIAWSWIGMGFSKWVLSRFPEAIGAFENSIRLSEKLHDTSNLISTYQMMSITALEWGHYRQSLEYALKFQELSGKELGVLASLYTAIGDYETALEFYRQTTFRSTGWPNKYMLLGSAFYLNKQEDSAKYYYRLFNNWAKTSGENWAKTTEPATYRKFLADLGEMNFILKQYDTALLYLNKVLRMHKEVNDRNQIMSVLLTLMKIYYETGEHKKAMLNAQELLHISNETGARQHSRDAHFILYHLFDLLHDRDSAYYHLRQYTNLKDSIDLDVTAQKIAFYKAKSAKEKSATEIRIINEERKLQQQQLKQAIQQKRFLVAGVVTLLLIGAAVLRTILLKRKNEKNLRVLAENELKIQKMESEKRQAALLQQSTELEMQGLRAQMNPHFIFNCLNAINGYILVNESEMAADYLTKFSRLIRKVLSNSYSKVISLAEELETLRLYLHMEGLRFRDNFHYRITGEDTLDSLSIFIPPMLLQPFVENAIWHGLMNKEGERMLLVDLYFDNNTLHCTIDDNGVGRKKAVQLKSKSAERNKSMGLEITKKRMELLNHDFNGQCFFEIIDLADELGNAMGTRVLLKIRTQDAPSMAPVGKLEKM